MYALSCDKCPLSLLCHTGVWNTMQGGHDIHTKYDPRIDAFSITVHYRQYLEYIYPALRGSEHADAVERYIVNQRKQVVQDSAYGVNDFFTVPEPSADLLYIRAPCNGSGLTLDAFERGGRRHREAVKRGEDHLTLDEALVHQDRRLWTTEELRDSIKENRDVVDLQLCMLEMDRERGRAGEKEKLWWKN